jgi:integrase
MALSAKGIEKLRKVPGRYRDDGEGGVRGLYLQITTNGASWSLRYEVQIPAVPEAKTWLERNGRRERWMGLGSLADFTLKEARARARDKRQLLADDIDPLDAKKAAKTAKALAAAKTVTFKEAAQQFIAQNEKKWRSQKHAAQWSSTLAEYAYPIIGGLAVADVDVGMVLKVLEQDYNGQRLWDAIPETASRLRGRVESVLGWAKVRNYRAGDNPAAWKNHLANVLPSRGKKAHHPALPYTRIGEFMAALREREGQVVRALEFTILTAARTGETIGARWSEIDLAAKLWTVPAGRIKGGIEHKVPLSNRAVAILEQLPREEGNDFVFIGTIAGQGLNDSALDRLSKGGSDPLVDVGGILQPDSSHTTGFGHGGKVRILELGTEVEKARGFLLDLDEAERAVVEHHDLHRQPELRKAEKIAHQHGEPTITRQRDYLPAWKCGLRTDRMRHRIGHRAMPK